MKTPAEEHFDGVAATMFYCGGDADAKAAAARLAADLGFDPLDAGALDQARLLEPLALHLCPGEGATA